MIYDEDALSNTILMENNPLDTFSRAFNEQDSMNFEKDMIRKISIEDLD